jgi:hypothetical protein
MCNALQAAKGRALITRRLAMALFVARHQHSPDRCPAADPQMGPALLTRLSPDNAAVQGVTTDAEAVVNDAHTRT